MTASPELPDPAHAVRGASFWLPPGGLGNGIPARAWAELADLSGSEVAAVLMELAGAGIAGYIAVPHQPRQAVQAYTSTARYRLWVDTLRYRSAENLLMDLLARLHGRRPPRGPGYGGLG